CGASAVSLHCPAGHRIGSLERRHLDLWKRLVCRRWRTVGRKLPRGLALDETLARLQPRPALLVRRHEIDKEMQRLDPPDPVRALFIAVLVHAIAPFGMLLVLPQHALIAPSRSRAAAIGGYVDRRLQRDPFVELPVDQPFLPAMEPAQILLDPLAARIDAVDPDLDRPVIGEQVRRLAPQAPVDIIAEGALQLLDRA